MAFDGVTYRREWRKQNPARVLAARCKAAANLLTKNGYKVFDSEGRELFYEPHKQYNIAADLGEGDQE